VRHVRERKFSGMGCLHGVAIGDGDGGTVQDGVFVCAGGISPEVVTSGSCVYNGTVSTSGGTI
jgi:hypothetical protein